MNYSPLLEIQIKTQRQNLWMAVGWAGSLFILGIAGSIAALFVGAESGNLALDTMKLGPLFITSAISSFPINRIMGCRERINYFVQVKFYIDNPSYLPPDQIQKLVEAVVEAIKDGLKSKA